MKSIVLNHSLKAFLIACTLLIVSIPGCKKELDPDSKDDPGAIQGAPGNPRFNLQFTNGIKTDLDLYVQTPNGSIIYYANPAGQNGKLDVDCLCGDCPNGPNENIYWTPGTAARGTYKVWVEYYGDCDGYGSSSTYTLRIMNNSSVIQTFTGSLSPNNDKSTVHTFNY
jgi:hypothetical protein